MSMTFLTKNNMNLMLKHSLLCLDRIQSATSSLGKTSEPDRCDTDIVQQTCSVYGLDVVRYFSILGHDKTKCPNQIDWERL